MLCIRVLTRDCDPWPVTSHSKTPVTWLSLRVLHSGLRQQHKQASETSVRPDDRTSKSPSTFCPHTSPAVPLLSTTPAVECGQQRHQPPAPQSAWLQRVGVATSSCWRAAHAVHSFPPPLPTPFPTTYFSPLPAFFSPPLSLRPWSGFPGCSPWPYVCWLQTLANPRHICTRFSLDSCSRMQKPIPLPTPLPLHTQPTPLP